MNKDVMEIPATIIKEDVYTLQRSAEAGPNEPNDEVSPEDLERVNLMARVPLKADQVFVRSMYLCSDRLCTTDWGRFTGEALRQISNLVVGRAVLRGHDRSSLPLARFFKAEVVKRDGDTFDSEVNPVTGKPTEWVRAWFYWIKGTTGSEDLRINIDGGVYREVSISWRYQNAKCSVCAGDIRNCGHTPGRSYSGNRCFFEVGEVLDVLEGSFVYRGAEGDAAIARDYGVFPTIPDGDSSASEGPVFNDHPMLLQLSLLPRILRSAIVSGPGDLASASILLDLGFQVLCVDGSIDRGLDAANDFGVSFDLAVAHELIDSGGLVQSDDAGIPMTDYRLIRGLTTSERDTQQWERSARRRLERLGYRIVRRRQVVGENGKEVSFLAERIKS